MPSAGARDEVTVHLDAVDLGPDRTVGVLRRDRSGSRSVLSFAFAAAWLRSRETFAIDPTLGLYEGEQTLSALAGIFTDAAPDRWGRVLLERREALDARTTGRRPRGLDDWDFLMGVNDATRMGALRFARTGDGIYLDHGPLTVPPSTQLRDLEQAARLIDDGAPLGATDEARWLAMLVAPGSSLGGTRPKASFMDPDGALWIAKFPSGGDRRDVGAWEYVVTRLAHAAGIAVPEAQLQRLASSYRTFAARRFDRVQQGGRRLYASAMTLVGKRDGETASYLDVAEAIITFGDPSALDLDLEELFRRAVFNVMVANRDDHLRNHGFLRARGGWRLAPAFDLNPAPDKAEHTLGLNEGLHEPDLGVLTDTADLYRLSAARTTEIVGDVRRAVAGWRPLAREVEIARDEIDLMAAAFEPRG